VGPGACAEGQILVVYLEKDGRSFVYFAAENGRYVFAEMVDGKPSTIYVGAQLPSPDHDVIKAVSHPYNPERDSGGPCRELFPQTS
jgi:hypothetical protein